MQHFTGPGLTLKASGWQSRCRYMGITLNSSAYGGDSPRLTHRLGALLLTVRKFVFSPTLRAEWGKV